MDAGPNLLRLIVPRGSRPFLHLLLRPLAYLACNPTDRGLLLSVSLDTRLLTKSTPRSQKPLVSSFTLPRWEIAMPKVRAVDQMNKTELRAELVSLLAEGFVRYVQSEHFAIDHANRDKDPDFETACLEVPANSVLSVTSRVNDR